MGSKRKKLEETCKRVYWEETSRNWKQRAESRRNEQKPEETGRKLKKNGKKI